MVVHGPSLPVNVPNPPTASEPARAIDQTSPTAPSREPSGENSLWKILTEEERQFFAQQAEMGPLTYGPKQITQQRSDAPIGQRVDLRV